jgi:hypothetical protein
MFGIDIPTNYNRASQKTQVCLLTIGAIKPEYAPKVGVIALKMQNRIS